MTDRTEYQREYRKANPGKAAQYQAKYRDSDPDKVRRQRRQSYHKNRDKNLEKQRAIREDALNAYGHRCVCCGESRAEFLAFDHIEGNGGKMRRDGIHPRSGKSFYQWLEKNGHPNAFRILCHNCNMAIGFYGYCPHNPRIAEESEKADTGGKSGS